MSDLRCVRLDRLPLATPVNRRWRSGPFGVFVSKEARSNDKLLVASIHDLLGGKPEPIVRDVMVSITWQTGGRLKMADVDAPIKGALDCLEKSGVLASDALVCKVDCERLPGRAKVAWMTITVEEIP